MYEYINIVSNNFFSNIKPEHFIFKYRIGYERHDIVESFFFDISNLSDKDFAKQFGTIVYFNLKNIVNIYKKSGDFLFINGYIV